MENEVLRNVLLVITMLAVFVFGFFVMKRLDKFLKKNYKPYYRENKKKDTNRTQRKNFFKQKKVREKDGKTKVVVSNEDNSCDE